MLAAIIIALGIPVYIYARKQNDPQEKLFSYGEYILIYILIVAAIAGIYAMARGIVSI